MLNGFADDIACNDISIGREAAIEMRPKHLMNVSSMILKWASGTWNTNQHTQKRMYVHDVVDIY